MMIPISSYLAYNFLHVVVFASHVQVKTLQHDLRNPAIRIDVTILTRTHHSLTRTYVQLFDVLQGVPTSLTRQRARHGSAGERLARLKLPTQLLKTRPHLRSRPSHVHCPIFLFGVTRSHGWWDASTRTDAPSACHLILAPPRSPSIESN